MPVIVMASPKGGAGKTTCSALLASGFARRGITVTIFDLDPNQALSIWASHGLPDNVADGGCPGAAEVVRAIRNADRDGHVVIVDLEGMASRTVSRAISQADLVIVPMQPTALDSAIGSGALTLIQEEEEALGRDIRHAVVLTRTSAIKSRVQRDLEAQLESLGIDVIEPPLMQRAAFGEIFTYGKDLETMVARPEITTAGKVDKAVENARQFVEAVYDRIAAE